MSKKTESIEIRLSPELKSALVRVSDGKGRSMSEMVRSLIEGEVEGRGQPQPNTGEPIMLRSTYTRALRAFAFALPILALASVYVLSAQAPAQANAEIRIFFAEVDENGDGRITLPEVETFLAEDREADPDCAEQGEPCTLAAYSEFQLNRADVDASADVSYAEFEAVNIRDWADDFLHADIDENGLLTVDEIVAVELYWALEYGTLEEHEMARLSAACLAQFEAEEIRGLADTCNLNTEGRAELAAYDADRSGTVSLLEYLNR
ncbi:hypothetical protein [Gymnodinialimonas hymeniacidonis]|uniref:hypothetical protein n=1 Tax=Gymnodinialimonas hymeniacidonis TaxID=3126508 RepID=UPI0034C6877F